MALVRLAAACQRLQPLGPDAGTTARLERRFKVYVAGRTAGGPKAWLASWLGHGPFPRPLVQRLAAGAVLLVSVGAGATAATGAGLGPVETSLDMLRNIVANLVPHGGGDPAGGGAPLAPATQTPFPPAATPTGTASPSPAAAAPAAAASATAAPALTGTQPPAAPATAAPPTATPALGTAATPPATAPAATPTPSLAPPPSPPPATGTATAPPAGGATPPPSLPSPSPSPSATPTPPPSRTPTPTPTPSTPSPAGDTTYNAGSAGTVTLRVAGSDLVIVSIQPNPGWVVKEQEASGNEASVKFVKGGTEVTFKAKLESGAVHITIESGPAD